MAFRIETGEHQDKVGDLIKDSGQLISIPLEPWLFCGSMIGWVGPVPIRAGLWHQENWSFLRKGQFALISRNPSPDASTQVLQVEPRGSLVIFEEEV